MAEFVGRIVVVVVDLVVYNSIPGIGKMVRQKNFERIFSESSA